MSEFIVSTIPNTTRVTIYCYTPKSILNVLKNPKYLKFTSKMDISRSKAQNNKSSEFGQEPCDLLIYILLIAYTT